MVNLIGNLNADLILAHVKERPQFGEEHMVDHMMFRPGGLANMIYPLAKLGMIPRVITILGKDDFGEKIYKELAPLMKDEGITWTDTPTALSVGIVNQTGARYFVTYSGNLYDFTEEIVKRTSKIKEAKASFFYGYFLLPNFGYHGTLASLKNAKASGQLTFFDSNSDIDGWTAESREEVLGLLPYIDYFMPNDEELAHLTGTDDLEKAVVLLSQRGARNIVVKRGSQGASAYAEGTWVHHQGYPTQAFDTTGAGDSFNAGFLYSCLQGDSIQQALAFGNAIASIVVSRKEDRYPTIEEIQERMGQGVNVEGAV